MTTDSAAFAAMRRSVGLCADCGADAGERSRCPKHLAVHAARERHRRAVRRLALMAVEEQSQ